MNNVYGHDVGDDVIKATANQLTKHFEGDIVARMGGEEFAVISKNSEYQNSFAHIHEFRNKIAKQGGRNRVEGKPYTQSMSKFAKTSSVE